MNISIQAIFYHWVTRVTLRPVFSGKVDFPRLRQRMERMDEWGRALDRAFERQEDRIEGVPCQWIRLPQQRGGRVVLYFHGGGFCTRTPVSHGQLLASICGAVGAVGLMPDYRLAPEDPFPASFEDCFAVYNGLLRSGVDPAQIVLAGDSAGGALVLGTLLLGRDAGLPLPACGVMLSPWSGRRRVPPPGEEKRDALLSPEAIAAFYQAWKPDAQPEHPLADLSRRGFAGLPPLLIQAGGDEMLLPDALEWAEKAQKAGVQATLQVFPGMAHAFQVAAFLPETKEAIKKIGGFTDQYLPDSGQMI